VIMYVVFKVRWVVNAPFETVGNHHIHFQFIELVILVVIKAVTILPQKLDICVDHLG
jgi:NADH:ubiquinone oxidoreductase subunit 3 (subunit A)